MSDHKQLKYFCHFQEGYVNPPQEYPEYFAGTIKWLRAVDLNDSYVDHTSRTLTERGFHSAGSSAVLFPKNSIAISKSGTIGVLGILEDEMCGNRAVINIRVDEDKVPLLYVFYLLKYKRNEIKNRAVGSIQKNLYVSALETIELCHTNKKDQNCISLVLTVIDRKIRNNNNICATLESLAQDLYHYWFTQFDFPDERGKPYRSSGGKMVWNKELGREIPTGWEVHKLVDIVPIVLGGTPNTKNKIYWENGEINWLSSGEIANFPVLSAEVKITQEAINNSATVLLKAGSVALSITRYIRPTILGIDACINQSVVGLEESAIYKHSFLYPFIKSQVSRYMSLRTGAMQPHINKETVEKTLIACPSDRVLHEYYGVSDIVFAQIMTTARETRELARLRDFLLPLLMNGQVKVIE